MNTIKHSNENDDGLVSEDWAARVCRIGRGETRCRYIVMSRTGWSCEKATPLGKYLNMRANNMQIIGRGDHCPGKKSR